MKLKYSKRFAKEYKKLTKTQKDLVNDTIEMFVMNPDNPLLNNHALGREHVGAYAISADDDLRIIYRQRNNYTYVIMLRVGTHQGVY